MKDSDPKLEYAVISGETRHVSEFAHLPRGQRPLAICPQCDGVIILKLGEKYRHHAAHKPDALCILTQPETVLHLNTKMYLYRELCRANRLGITQECDGWRSGHTARECGHGARLDHLWLKDWEGVEVERYVGTRKPDITFYRGSVPVAAIEVYATHAVDKEKEAYLLSLGIPFLEVKASTSIYEGSTAWKPQSPLPHVKCSPALPAWTCEGCITDKAKYAVQMEEARVAAERRRVEEAKRAADERKREDERIARLRALQSIPRLHEENKLYPPHTELTRLAFAFKSDGTRDKLEYFITRERITPDTDRVSLIFGRDRIVLFSEVGKYDSRTLKTAREARAQHLELYKQSSEFIVEVTGWVLPLTVTQTLTNWRSPYLWDPNNQRWSAVSQQKSGINGPAPGLLAPVV